MGTVSYPNLLKPGKSGGYLVVDANGDESFYYDNRRETRWSQPVFVGGKPEVQDNDYWGDHAAGRNRRGGVGCAGEPQKVLRIVELKKLPDGSFFMGE